VDGRAYVESPRWHDGRLWFAHWGTGEIVAVDTDGQSEVVGHGPPTVSAAVPGHSLGWSIDWLPDGRLLITSKELARREARRMATQALCRVVTIAFRYPSWYA